MFGERKTKFKIHKIGNYIVEGLTLGKGNFARVELATHAVVSCSVALKIIDISKIKEEYVVCNLERESKILAKLDHPNVVKLYEIIRSNSLYCLVLEYVQGCHLGHYINKQPGHRIPESTARSLFYQLFSAVEHMHNKSILHRDLKPENVLVENGGRIKLVVIGCDVIFEAQEIPTDSSENDFSFLFRDSMKRSLNYEDTNFGISNFYDPNQPLRTRCGTPEYAAPELFTLANTYGPGVDMWSLGVILYAMIVGGLPFRYPRNEADTLRARRQLLFQKISKGLGKPHREAMKHVSSDCQNLVENLLEPNWKKRITLKDVVVHSWLCSDPLLHSLVVQTDSTNSSQVRPMVLNRLSSLLKVPLIKLEKKISKRMYNHVHAMYELLLDKTILEKEKEERRREGKEDLKDLKEGFEGFESRERISVKTNHTSLESDPIHSIGFSQSDPEVRKGFSAMHLNIPGTLSGKSSHVSGKIILLKRNEPSRHKKDLRFRKKILCSLDLGSSQIPQLLPANRKSSASSFGFNTNVSRPRSSGSKNADHSSPESPKRLPTPVCLLPQNSRSTNFGTTLLRNLPSINRSNQTSEFSGEMESSSPDLPFPTRPVIHRRRMNTIGFSGKRPLKPS